jgi:hypothetical protein
MGYFVISQGLVMKREILTVIVALTLSLTGGGSRAATSVILDGTFQERLTPLSQVALDVVCGRS